MELEKNVPILSNFINMIEREAKKFESNSGEVEFLISRELLEKAVAEELLFTEIEKGKQSVSEGRTHTRADFQRKYGLAK